MALFFGKKKEKIELPKLPEFPSYTPTIKPASEELSSIKTFVQRPTDLTIPIRQKNMIAETKPEFKRPDITEVRKPLVTPLTRPVVSEEKPLFVKIEKYKEATHLVDRIKAKLAEAERTLVELSRINDEEERNLRAWKEELEKIKEKLLDIDKHLFEV